MIIKFVICRLNKNLEAYPRRWKLQKGILVRDFQKHCQDLSKYSELKKDWIEFTFITSEMLDSLLANTKYIYSNDIFLTKVNKNKLEITRNL